MKTLMAIGMVALYMAVATAFWIFVLWVIH